MNTKSILLIVAGMLLAGTAAAQSGADLAK